MASATRASAQSEAPLLRGLLALGLAGLGNLALLAFFAAFLWRTLPVGEGLVDSVGLPIGRDFTVFWTVAVLAAEVDALALFDPAALQALWAERFASWDMQWYSWAHPPQMLFVIWPLASLDYLWALAAWSLAGLAAYALAVRKAALLAAPATFINLFMGQTGLLVGALFFGALRLAERRPVLAGALCGLIAIKPHLGLMIPVALLAARAWRTALGATLAVGALALASGLAFGWEAWRLWLVQAMTHQASLLQELLGGAVTVSAFTNAKLLGMPTWAAWLMQAPITLAAALATWWAFSRWRRGLAPAAWAVAVLLLSTCLATPYLFVYDLALLSPVTLHALGQWRRGPWARNGMRLTDLGELLVWLAVWLLPLLAIVLNPRGLPIASAVLLAALGLCIWRLRGFRPA